MTAAVVDTNIVVAALWTRDARAPTAVVLDAMLNGTAPFALSVALLAEYRQVLLRPHIADRHGLDAQQVEALLTRLAQNAILRVPHPCAVHPSDPNDQFVVDLVACIDDAILVTGDTGLLALHGCGLRVLTPRDALDVWLRRK